MKQTIKLFILTLFFITGCSDSTTKAIENNQTEVLNENNSTNNNPSNENNITNNNHSNENNVTDNNSSNENNSTDNNSSNENNSTDNNNSNENNSTDNNSSNENNSIDNNSSNENNSTDNNPSNENNSTLTGKVIDGEIAEATLFLDLDRDNELDDNEPYTVTKLDGSYVLVLTKKQREHQNYVNKTAPLVVYGGKDIRTQEIFDDYLMALRDESNLTYITPFSTLIAQTLFDELEEINSNKLQKASGEKHSSLDEKIALIKKNLAELFGLSETILDKDPIALAKSGDTSLLSQSLQLHKSAKSMKQAMKKDVRKLKKSILKSYRALAKEFKKLKRDALKNKDEAIVEALNSAMDDTKLFDADLVKMVKAETKEIVHNINEFWKGKEGTLTDNALSDAIKEGESKLNSDTISPIITLLGESTVNLIQGTTYIDRGATAMDNRDGDISSNIQINNSVDTNNIGTYRITYDVSDSSGNVATQIIRTVKVNTKPVEVIPDTTKPIITLLGDTSITLKIGETYTDAGATASDDRDGDISSSIVVFGSVNTSIASSYTITYNVNDSAGNSAIQVTRTVQVNAVANDDDTTPPNNNIIADTTPPTAPTIVGTLSHFTNQESISIMVNGEKDSALFINGVSFGVLNADGVLNSVLNTSGEDGEKDFNLTLKDSSNNESSALTIKIIKDTVPPAQNSTIDSLTTDDTTPALSGKLPSGSNDSNTTNYTVTITIESESYTATNDRDGTWSIAKDMIDSLEMGKHDVNISVTDEANNTSSTFIAGKIEIDNTGFLIDSAIEGIKYISGAYSGYTDKDGLFKYDKGAGVTFYIGDESTGISLGTATEKIDPYNSNRRIITLFDLAGTQDENNVRLINMGKLLQSLDEDNDVSNGITIDERTKESIALLGLKNRIDFNMDIETFHNHNDIYELFNDLAGHFGEHRGLVDTEDAKAHMVSVRDNTLPTKNYNVAKVSGKKEVTTVLDGVFQSVGGVVEGLEYRSGNQFGRTNANGAFKYEEGKTVKFYIYQLELGITEAKAVVTPADLVPATSFNHPKPRNIIRLLNAFDKPNTANIYIDNAVREALEKYRSQIDINLPDGKANTELGIPAGVDEFGAQFEDFEMGKDILDEINRLRG